MILLTDTEASDPAARQRILINRTGPDVAVRWRPLLVAPEARSVSMAPPDYKYLWSGDGAVHQGAVYFTSLKTPELRVQLYRIGLPDVKPALFAADVPPGTLIFGGDGLHIIGQKWWRLRTKGKLDDMGFVPWHFHERFAGAGRRWVKADRDDINVARPEACVICRSRYYGFLVSTTIHEANPNQEYTTYQVSFQEEKAVPAAPLVYGKARR